MLGTDGLWGQTDSLGDIPAQGADSHPPPRESPRGGTDGRTLGTDRPQGQTDRPWGQTDLGDIPNPLKDSPLLGTDGLWGQTDGPWGHPKPP